MAPLPLALSALCSAPVGLITQKPLDDLVIYDVPVAHKTGTTPVTFALSPLEEIPINGGVVKYCEIIVEKLKADGWQVRWTEAMHDGAVGWTATAIRGKDRHSTHANDVTLAIQELEANCTTTPKQSVAKSELLRK